MHLHKFNRLVISLVLVLQGLWLNAPQPASAQRKPGRRAPARTSTQTGTAGDGASDKPASRYVVEGLRYAGEGQWAEAIKAYRHALVDNPQDADAYLNMGDAYLNTGNDKEAIAAYQQAVRFAPRSADAQYSLGAAYNFTEQYSAAFKPLVQAVNLDPAYAEAYYGIGYAYQKLDNYKDALGYLQKAIRLKPDYPDAYLALGLTQLGLGNVKAAEAQLKALQGMDATAAKELDKAITKAAGAARATAQATPAAQSNQAPTTPQSNAQATEPKPGRATAPTAGQAVNNVAPLAVELSFWDSIKNSNDPAEYAAYLKKYPDGQFVELARIRLRALESKKSAPATNAVERTHEETPPVQPDPAQAQASASAAPARTLPDSTPPVNEPMSSPSPTSAPPGHTTPPAAEKPAEAETPATLEETLGWIKLYLPVKFTYQFTTAGAAPGAPPVAHDARVDYELLRFDSCQLEWRDQSDTLAVALADLDPASVKVEPRRQPDTTFSVEVWNLSITASGGKGAFTETKGDPDGAVNHYNGIDLQYNDKARAERLARALQRAIKLCGGQSAS
ncbi:MAG TPA: tetratricopeptide repeat protein [Pyrinomonadaceae bacterium]|jgi:tetratricopeptide (TPR) repeat protein